MPLWFPFAIAASLLISMGAGARSGWKTQADIAEEERKRREAGPIVQGRPGRARWPHRGFPAHVTFGKRVFQKIRSAPPHGLVAVYHEVHGPASIAVLRDGNFVLA